jgi:hypothetical protein
MTSIDPSTPDRPDDGPDHAKPPTEAKVKAARLAAGVATLAVTFVLRHVPALDAIQGTDNFLTGLVADGLMSGLAFGAAWLAGWRAKHTRRPDLPLSQR